ncbi:MAG: gfo/Idh/MocA family oxidoreductase [Chloroflexi bacterium]|nr:gfo/Idh/MocA family oxidoreductase [Chloroflexota bacterium]
MPETVKMAVIGLGVMGREHIKSVATLENTELVAICDVDRAAADKYAAEMNTTAYYDYRDLLEHQPLDAILIATPHYDHTPITIAALHKGIHVLVEKPIAVQVKDGNKMIAAYEESKRQFPDLVFSAVFMQRTYGYWRKIKSIIDGGELGRLIRITWVVTDWFRTQKYYDAGSWRATWQGEGGGVLLNQAMHHLDLYQWFVGMPKQVTGFVGLGKYHHIEVEDEVTAYFEYKNGTVGHFITSTSETPGTNRLEIIGDGGKLIFEDRRLMLYRNRQSAAEQIEQGGASYNDDNYETLDVPFEHHNQSGHRMIIENFANAIRHGEPLIVPGVEGVNSVMLANAILLSSFERRTVDLPLDEDAYEQKLHSLIAASTFRKA